MKTTINSYMTLAILLLLTMGLMGCDKDDEPVKNVYLGGIEVPYRPIPLEEMPNWMREMLSTKGFAIAEICQGEYNGNVVYNILNGYSSNLTGDNYNKDGERYYGVDINQVKNWVCIYYLYFMY
jgi:hypothetical protein